MVSTEESINLFESQKETNTFADIKYRNLCDHQTSVVSYETKVYKKQQQKLLRNILLCVFGLLIVTIVVISYFTSIMAADKVSSASSRELIAKLSTGNVEFTKKLYNVIKRKEGNVLYSPISLELALMLAYNGADGNTAEEIRKALSLPETKEETLLAGESVMNLFQSTENLTLKAANGIFFQKDCTIKENYVSTLRKHLSAEAKTVDFGKNADAAKIINDFVDEHTNHKITELFSPDSLSEDTRVVLVNAVYFLGMWDKKFNANDSYEGDFHLNEKDKVKVNFMTQTNDFEIAINDELNFTLVNLPYAGNEVKMVLLVPHEINGLASLEENIQNLDLVQLSKGTRKRKVHLTMPKFKLEETLNLESILKEIGIGEMLDPKKADFKHISEAMQLYVDKVVQKAFIEVDEKGTEAAAATGIKLQMRMMPLPPLELKIQSPFLFFLYHNEGVVLFMGRVQNVSKV